MRFDLYAIGNALVDQEIRVSDARLHELEVDKGRMTLIDPPRLSALLQALHHEPARRTGGGSAGNTVVALAQLGGRAAFSYRVAADSLGAFYRQELDQLGVTSFTDHTDGAKDPTGQCLVLVTPDSQRSMSTSLGITSLLDATSVDHAALAQSQVFYIEGYLAASPTGCRAALAGRETALRAGVKVALTLSDVNMIRYCRLGLEAFLEGGIDVLFCNEEEAHAWVGSEDLDLCCEALAGWADTVCLTRGHRGCVVLQSGARFAVPAPAIQAVDSNGAGDMFAGAFLYALTHGHGATAAAELANHAAAAVVAQSGNRLEAERMRRLRAEWLNRQGV